MRVLVPSRGGAVGDGSLWWCANGATLAACAFVSAAMALSPRLGIVIFGVVGLVVLAAHADVLRVLLGAALLWNLVSIHIVKVLGVLPFWAYYLSDACLVLSIAVLVGRRTAAKAGRPPLGIGVLPYVVFFVGLAGVYAGLSHGSDALTTGLGLRWLLYPVLGVMLMRLAPPERSALLVSTIKILVFGILLTQLPMAAYQIVTKVPLPAPEFAGSAGAVFGVGVRAYGLMGWPTTLALVLLVPCLALSLRWLKGETTRSDSVALVLLLLLLLLTFSRGGVVSFVVGFVVGLLSLRRRSVSVSGRRLGAVVALGLTVLGPVLVIGLSGLLYRASDFSLNNYDRSVAQGGRIALVRVGKALLADSPVSGIGPGRFGTGMAVAGGTEVERVVGERILTAESSALRVTVEQGAVGAVGLMLVLGLPAWGLRAGRDRGVPSFTCEQPLYRAIAVSCLSAYAVTTLIAPSLEIRQVALPLWIVIGCTLPPASRSSRCG